MPYKLHSDRLANRRHQGRLQQLAKLNSLGLYAFDPIDKRSNVVCFTCGKETKWSAPLMFRHHPTCAHYEDTLKEAGKTQADTRWSRQKGSSRRPRQLVLFNCP